MRRFDFVLSDNLLFARTKAADKFAAAIFAGLPMMGGGFVVGPDALPAVKAAGFTVLVHGRCEGCAA